MAGRSFQSLRESVEHLADACAGCSITVELTYDSGQLVARQADVIVLNVYLHGQIVRVGL